MPYTDPRRKKANDQRYYAENRASLIAKDYARYSGIYRSLIGPAKKRAKEKGLEFNIDSRDISIPEFCPILGIRLERRRGQGKGCQYSSPSLDRIDSSRGYVQGNVHVISHLANTMKSAATLEQLIAFARWVQSRWVLQ